jgi:hypothetical protein
MLIQYTGHSTVRLVEQYRWDKANGFVCDVADALLAVNLLTEPGGAFVIAPVEPLLAVPDIGAQRAAELALGGIANIGQLARLTQDDGKRIADATSFSERQVAAWVLAARNILGLDSGSRKRAAKTIQEV